MQLIQVLCILYLQGLNNTGTNYVSYYDTVSRGTEFYGTSSSYNIRNVCLPFYLNVSNTYYVSFATTFTTGGSGQAPSVTSSSSISFVRIG